MRKIALITFCCLLTTLTYAQTQYPTYVLDGVVLKKDIDYSKELLNPEEIAEINVLKGESAVKEYGKVLGKNGIILITTKKGNKSGIPNNMIRSYDDGNPVFILDGEVVKRKAVKDLNPNEIEQIDVLKNNIELVKKYGIRALNGIVKVTRK